ncbi:MAG: S8 family serine peptidase [Proteobacteria bacterium]|nr:S8 family serine peptidase [Pseudomonadota bacterium]
MTTHKIPPSGEEQSAGVDMANGLSARFVGSTRLLTGAGIRVGVIDSGWDRTRVERQVHAGVSFRMRPGSDQIVVGKDDHDRLGHGTACTGLLLDLAPAVEVTPLRVFEAKLETSPEVLLAAIDWAVAHEIRVLNLSLGTMRNDAAPHLFSACKHARQEGTIIVAASNPATGWCYPAIFEDVIGVAGGNVRHPFGHRYIAGAAVECVASFGPRPVRGLAGRSAITGGSSVAAAVVAGKVALLLDANPTASYREVHAMLASASER